MDHPPGFEGPNSRFFRPVMSSFGDDSILLTGSKIVTGESDDESFMNEIFQYKVGTGWINLGQLGKAIYIRFAWSYHGRFPGGSRGGSRQVPGGFLVRSLPVPGGFLADFWQVPGRFLVGS